MAVVLVVISLLSIRGGDEGVGCLMGEQADIWGTLY